MFWSKDKKSKSENKKGNLIGALVLVLSVLLSGVLIFFKDPKKISQFLKGQKREIKELRAGQEDFSRFCSDSGNLFKDLFIPYCGNDNRPKILRPKALLSYAVLAVVMKVFVIGFLFTTYPSLAQLSEIVSDRMINLTNQARQESGVEPLQFNADLAAAALAKGEDMIARQYFAHDTPDGKRPWQWIDRRNYDYVYAGENLAMDFVSAELVQEAFMKSPSHQKNILNPRYKEVGMAVLNGEINGHQTILLVEFFGTQRKDLSSLAAAQPSVIVPAGSAVATPEVKTQPAVNVNNQPTVQPAVAGEQIEEVSAPINPEPDLSDLEVGSANEGIIVIAGSHQNSKALVDFIIEYSNIFFIAFLIFILISLCLNIFINIRVQHSSVILQTVAVAALMLAMVLVKFHFVEQVAPQILIL